MSFKLATQRPLSMLDFPTTGLTLSNNWPHTSQQPVSHFPTTGLTWYKYLVVEGDDVPLTLGNQARVALLEIDGAEDGLCGLRLLLVLPYDLTEGHLGQVPWGGGRRGHLGIWAAIGFGAFRRMLR